MIKVVQMFKHTRGTRPLFFHATSIVIIFKVFGRFISWTLPILLCYLNITPLLVVQLSFFKNLMNDYYGHHGIENSFHDYDHILVLINIHKFQMMLHLLWFFIRNHNKVECKALKIRVRTFYGVLRSWIKLFHKKL